MLRADGQTLDNCQPADVLRLMDTLRASLSPPGVASAVAAVATMMDMLGIPLPRDKLVSMYLDGLQKMACKSTDRVHSAPMTGFLPCLLLQLHAYLYLFWANWRSLSWLSGLVGVQRPLCL